MMRRRATLTTCPAVQPTKLRTEGPTWLVHEGSRFSSTRVDEAHAPRVGCADVPWPWGWRRKPLAAPLVPVHSTPLLPLLP
mmetsp:Transcript_7846/g.23171  ORF Transcript_7846/g.23171 Transcript_7846/m.23171 type:complete len:81 (+) Transcript_7846:443-685(+)